MAPRLLGLHILRDLESPKTLCSRPASAGAIALVTIPVAYRANLKLCAECVRNFARIRHEDQPYRPWRDQSQPG